MAEVRFSKVSKVYAGDVHAVTDFDLTVRDREFVVLVGPSGCGKSTALRMVAGLEDISSGDLFVDGKRVNDLPPKNRDIAMVFQNYALYPHMNVYDNMAFGLKLRRFSKAEIDKRVREAAEILGLSDYLKRRPKALSGGQRQRVAVGRSIVRKPKVFLFDEPLSNLDAKMRVQMRKEICQLHQRIQATMIYVTHDQTEAMTMGDRIVVMKDGVIQQVDKPLEIYHRPSNVFVGGFIGSPEMNFFDCRFTDGTLTFKGNAMPLTEQAADRIKANGTSEVRVGIRPEDMAVANGHGETPVFDATVEITELLGAEVFVYAKTAGIPFIAKVRGTANYSIGDSIQVTVNPEKVHVFDTETQVAI